MVAIEKVTANLTLSAHYYRKLVPSDPHLTLARRLRLKSKLQLTFLGLLLSVSPACAQTTPHQDTRVVKSGSQQPLTVGGKFRYFANESFRPGVFLVGGFYTGLAMANPPKAYPREWRQGAAGFGRNYGDFIASCTAVQGGKFIAASALHEDPRYIRSSSRNLF